MSHCNFQDKVKRCSFKKKIDSEALDRLRHRSKRKHLSYTVQERTVGIMRTDGKEAYFGNTWTLRIFTNG